MVVAEYMAESSVVPDREGGTEFSGRRGSHYRKGGPITRGGSLYQSPTYIDVVRSTYNDTMITTNLSSPSHHIGVDFHRDHNPPIPTITATASVAVRASKV